MRWGAVDEGTGRCAAAGRSRLTRPSIVPRCGGLAAWMRSGTSSTPRTSRLPRRSPQRWRRSIPVDCASDTGAKQSRFDVTGTAVRCCDRTAGVTLWRRCSVAGVVVQATDRRLRKRSWGPSASAKGETVRCGERAARSPGRRRYSSGSAARVAGEGRRSRRPERRAVEATAASRTTWCPAGR
jgi:hypothetical protein